MLRPGCYTHVHNPLAFVGCLITCMYLPCMLTMKKLFGSFVYLKLSSYSRKTLLDVNRKKNIELFPTISLCLASKIINVRY